MTGTSISFYQLHFQTKSTLQSMMIMKRKIQYHHLHFGETLIFKHHADTTAIDQRTPPDKNRQFRTAVHCSSNPKRFTHSSFASIIPTTHARAWKHSKHNGRRTASYCHGVQAVTPNLGPHLATEFPLLPFTVHRGQPHHHNSALMQNTANTSCWIICSFIGRPTPYEAAL